MKKSAILAPSTLNFAAIVRWAPEAFQAFFSQIARLKAVSNNRRVHKDVLLNYPAERERWFEFESHRQRDTIEAWARNQGVEIN